MIAQREVVELQRRITLDDALLEGSRTFNNGCNFRLRRMANGTDWLEYGCYGVHVNLCQGAEYLLAKWVGIDGRGDGYAPKRLDGLVHPETLVELLRREPCRVCGGARHEALA